MAGGAFLNDRQRGGGPASGSQKGGWVGKDCGLDPPPSSILRHGPLGESSYPMEVIARGCKGSLPWCFQAGEKRLLAAGWPAASGLRASCQLAAGLDPYDGGRALALALRNAFIPGGPNPDHNQPPPPEGMGLPPPLERTRWRRSSDDADAEAIGRLGGSGRNREPGGLGIPPLLGSNPFA